MSCYFCLVIEGSGSGTGSVPLTNGSGSGSRRPRNIQIPRIRIHNTGCMYELSPYAAFGVCFLLFIYMRDVFHIHIFGNKSQSFSLLRNVILELGTSSKSDVTNIFDFIALRIVKKISQETGNRRWKHKRRKHKKIQ